MGVYASIDSLKKALDIIRHYDKKDEDIAYFYITDDETIKFNLSPTINISVTNEGSYHINSFGMDICNINNSELLLDNIDRLLQMEAIWNSRMKKQDIADRYKSEIEGENKDGK